MQEEPKLRAKTIFQKISYFSTCNDRTVCHTLRQKFVNSAIICLPRRYKECFSTLFLIVSSNIQKKKKNHNKPSISMFTVQWDSYTRLDQLVENLSTSSKDSKISSLSGTKNQWSGNTFARPYLKKYVFSNVTNGKTSVLHRRSALTTSNSHLQANMGV